ncbi:hypothetical protein C0J52_11400 [Blattella germanica]|nr:hypothetical protein C0J52_11400 [Blattella germanica]
MEECKMETKLFQLEVPAIIHSDLSRKKGGSLKYDLYSKRSSLVERDVVEGHKYKWSSVRLGRRPGSEKRESVVKIDASANGGPFPANQQPIKVIGKEVTPVTLCTFEGIDVGSVVVVSRLCGR